MWTVASLRIDGAGESELWGPCRPGIPAGDPPRPLTGPTLECPSRVLIEPHQQRDSG